MWNPFAKLSESIAGHGGFVNAHAHFDRAYSVSLADFNNAHGNINSHLFDKWKLVDKFKQSSSEENYYQHILAALINQHDQGVRHCLSFIDCDPIAEERALKAAIKAKEYAAKNLKMNFLIACQTLKGVLDKNARFWFEKALEHVDVIGGLPGVDAGKEKEHLDVLFKAAKETGKRVHVHVDQLNSPAEKETELLARTIIEWGLEGKVTAVHGISIAAHSKSYRTELYKLCHDAGLSFVACPTAWIDSRRTEVLSPTHNSVTPIDEMIPAGLTVALGSDNICDIYKPFADGNMLTELKLLLEANHYYEMDELLRIATINGLKVLGLD
ncbi:amidohydrolase family protein [Fluviispira multicolorata]|uniref:Amidohydrolase family protein n=1 Tax=Fluviispira multicolorata TaxID=2654512 RepID=A0A833N7P6_9BACT|nr:amidohydrolase family protein [Fluviispira multicolorata]KAB8033206.1 amidohydrolase family protein [Fluviispira multicolorata]